VIKLQHPPAIGPLRDNGIWARRSSCETQSNDAGWPPVSTMSATGPKRTSLVALHMSAFGGKADIAIAVPNRGIRLP
jgi:hypothetical protein